jgi:hypothetical protein
MRVRLLIHVFGICAVAPAQLAVDAGRAQALQASPAGAEPLYGCDFSKVEPALSYSLQFQAGYTCRRHWLRWTTSELPGRVADQGRADPRGAEASSRPAGTAD